MDKEIYQVLNNIEKRIRKSEILCRVLEDRSHKRQIVHEDYLKIGYTQDEIETGIKLVELYLSLKEYSDDIKEGIGSL